MNDAKMYVPAPGRSRIRVPAVVAAALAVTCFYGLFTVAALALHGWDPLWFAWLGQRYLDLDPGAPTGYDGQFVYYLARYGGDAMPRLDNPPYRLQRILLPAVVRLLSLGQPALVPWAIIAVNLAAILSITWGLAAWLKKHDLSAWYALMYALYVGTLMAYSRDLTEPLALCLAAWGAVWWQEEKHVPAILSLSLAALAKETALLFVLGIACSELARKQFRLAAGSSLALLPWLAWEGYLFARLGTWPLTAGPALEPVPLSGIVPYLSLEPGRLSSLLFVALPALALVLISLLLLIRQRGRLVAPWWVLLNGAFVLLLPLNVYEHIMHAGRNAGGLVLSALFLLPFLAPCARLFLTSWWVLPTAVWLVPVLRWLPG
jgi:hypothetical protein